MDPNSDWDDVLAKPRPKHRHDPMTSHLPSVVVRHDDARHVMPSAERATDAYISSLEQDALDHAKRHDKMLAKLPSTPTRTELMRLRESMASSARILSSIGYHALRALHSEGLLYATIAYDLGVPYADLLAFMRQHPNAEADAFADDENCADAMLARLLREMEDKTLTREQAQVIETRVKLATQTGARLSGAWAQRTPVERTVEQHAQIRLFLDASATGERQNKVIEHEANPSMFSPMSVAQKDEDVMQQIEVDDEIEGAAPQVVHFEFPR